MASIKKITSLILTVALLSPAIFAQQPKLILPVGHTSWVTMSHFSPNGKLLATASLDGTAKIWDVRSGKLLANLLVHKDSVMMAQFSPVTAEDKEGGRYVVTASADKVIKIWDSNSGELLKQLEGHKGAVSAVQFSPDGTKLLSASADTSAIIWDLATGMPLRILRGHNFALASAEFSPDGNKILTTSSRNQYAILWNAATGDSIAHLTGHRSFLVHASFSPDSKQIVTTSRDSTARLWDANNGQPLRVLKKHLGQVNHAAFSPKSETDSTGGKYIVTAGDDRSIIISETASAVVVGTGRQFGNKVLMAQFSPDGSLIIAASADRSARLFNLEGTQLKQMKGHKGSVLSAVFSPNGKMVATTSADKTSMLYSINSDSAIFELQGHTSAPTSVQCSPDGTKWLTTYTENSARVWNAFTGKLMYVLEPATTKVNTASFSRDGKFIVSACTDTMARVYDAISGKLVHELKETVANVKYAQFSPDGSRIVTVSRDKNVKLWDVSDGSRMFQLIGHNKEVALAQFSPPTTTDSVGGGFLVTASDDSTAIIWDINNAKKLHVLSDHKGKVFSARYSMDGKMIVTASWDATAMIWDAGTGTRLHTLIGHKYAVKSAQFSLDGHRIITLSEDNTAKVWNADNGKYLFDLVGHNGLIGYADFSPDGQEIITASNDHTAKLWELETGKLKRSFEGHSKPVSYVKFVPQAPGDSSGLKKIITVSNDNTTIVWDANKSEKFYTSFTIDSTDYLTVDKDFRYDGSDAARKLLYFTCGTEVIGLDQVKDSLWVPNLSEHILKNMAIDAATLKDLNVCGLTPLVEDLSIDTNYRFRITPRRGGLGEIILYVNGIESKKYSKGELANNNGAFELSIQPSQLAEYFVAGRENVLTIKAFTADNGIVSRGTSVIAQAKAGNARPNLYAVIIGVSDYEGTRLDLNYSAKDAKDISAAISITAKKMLNTDNDNHVFMFDLTTETPQAFPNKKSIKEVFDNISKKATANDILLIFFAGHGIIKGPDNNKQFYFLTAEAATFSDSLSLTNAAISMAELSEWTKPSNIKAQKRILIFDACNSGGAIKDWGDLNASGSLTSRGDDKAQQIKAIDKLNEKSGLFILSASASSQSAFEVGRYSQGLLTYSLLKAILQEPDILIEGKFLDISRWFSAAEKGVNELALENGVKQQPQILANTNFSLGLVDAEVQSKITIEKGKPLIAGTNLQNNDEDIAADNLGLNKMVNETLQTLSATGANASFVFAPGSNSPDAYSLSGRYTELADSVSVTLRIIYQNKTLPVKFPLKNAKDKLPELADAIARKVDEWIRTQQ
jgi:WD40 repeat protein